MLKGAIVCLHLVPCKLWKENTKVCYGMQGLIANTDIKLDDVFKISLIVDLINVSLVLTGSKNSSSLERSFSGSDLDRGYLISRIQFQIFKCMNFCCPTKHLAGFKIKLPLVCHAYLFQIGFCWYFKYRAFYSSSFANFYSSFPLFVFLVSLRLAEPRSLIEMIYS